jgi:predicted nucleotidyltransferase
MTPSKRLLDYDAEALRRLCQKWRVVELAIFGSAARGELRPDSDVDVMVAFDADAQIGWDIVLLRDELERLFGRPVDLVTASVLENPFRRRTIEPDLTVVYAA